MEIADIPALASNVGQIAETDIVPYILPTDLQEEFNIHLHRVNLKKELITFFEDSDIVNKFLKVRMINDHGYDEQGEGSGVVRDAFSLFWQDSYVSLMLGEEERVPCIRHDMGKQHWQAVARIFLKGFLQAGYFPIQISQVFLISLMFGEDAISNDMYLESFKRYVSRAESDIIEKVLGGKLPLDDDDFVDFLSAFDCKKVVDEANITEILIELAHKELVQKPSYVADCWEKLLTPLKLHFATTEELVNHLSFLQPTSAKICRMFNATPANPAEAETLAYLKRWVKGLDDTCLRRFLRLSTGADILIGAGIQVTFTTLSGAGRRPIFHTCGSVLEIPSTYDDFCDFRQEFTNIVNQQDIEMDLV